MASPPCRRWPSHHPLGERLLARGRSSGERRAALLGHVAAAHRDPEHHLHHPPSGHDHHRCHASARTRRFALITAARRVQPPAAGRGQGQEEEDQQKRYHAGAERGGGKERHERHECGEQPSLATSPCTSTTRRCLPLSSPLRSEVMYLKPASNNLTVPQGHAGCHTSFTGQGTNASETPSHADVHNSGRRLLASLGLHFLAGLGSYPENL